MTDQSFQEHNKRQFAECSPERLRERALALGVSDHFKSNGSQWVVGAYPGFGMLAMVNENPLNNALLKKLEKLQEELVCDLDCPGGLYLLSPESFHQTVANILSAGRFQKQIVDRGLTADFPALVADVFSNIEENRFPEPVRMRITGLGIFGSGIVALGIFENETDYQRITGFRNFFYGNPVLSGLDIKMTRPFVGHITLAYLGRNLDDAEKQLLANIVAEMNHDFEETSYYFFIREVGLRQYKDLSGFDREIHYPVITI